MTEHTPTADSSWSDQPSNGRRHRGGRLLFGLPIALVVASIWLPFGFSLGGLIEEWDVLGLFNIHGPFFLATPRSPLPVHSLRPLTIFPQALAYYLDPDSFFFWNVLLILGLIVKGVAAAHLAKRVFHSARWGVLMGVLTLLYPADTMQLSFRSLHINWALAILLMGSNLLLDAREHRTRPFSWGLAIAAAAAVFIANCMYEASVALIFLPLIMMYAQDGLRATARSSRDNASIMAAWFLGVAAYIAFVLYTAPKIASYQASILGSASPAQLLLSSLPRLFSIGAMRAMLGGWIDAVRMVGSEFSSYWYLAVAALAIALAIFKIPLRPRVASFASTTQEAVGWQTGARVICAGVLLALLGYAPYLVSPAHQAISQRTYLFATPGAALAWTTLVVLLFQWKKSIGATLAITLVFVGLAAQLVQLHYYVGVSNEQRKLLTSLVESFDGRTPDQTVLVLDGRNELGQTWMFNNQSRTLAYALSYVYGKPVKAAEICRMPSHEWQNTDALGRKGTCVEQEHQWVLRYPDPAAGPGYIAPAQPADSHLLKSDTRVVELQPDGSSVPDSGLAGYRSYLATSDSAAARRYRNVLRTPHYEMHMFKDQQPQPSLHWSFGKWWSMETLVRGSGWRATEWSEKGLSHESAAWKARDQAALYFDMAPTPQQYVLRASFDIVLDASRGNLIVTLNGARLPYRWVTPNDLEAEVPAHLLHERNNVLMFGAPVDAHYYGLSMRLTGVDITNGQTVKQ